MKRLRLAAEVVGLLVIAGMCAENRSLASNQRATLNLLAEQQATTRRWQAKYAVEAAHVERDADTVRVRVTRVDTLRQTLNIHDTTDVIRYIAATDTALRACTELADSCALFRVTADATTHSLTVERDAWRRMYEAKGRGPRLAGSGEFLHNPFTKENALAAGGTLRLFGEVSALARVERRMVRGDTTRFWVGARVRLW